MLKKLKIDLREIVAQAWCTAENKHKEMDADLANAIVEKIGAKILSIVEMVQVQNKALHEIKDITKETTFNSVYKICDKALDKIDLIIKEK